MPAKLFQGRSTRGQQTDKTGKTRSRDTGKSHGKNTSMVALLEERTLHFKMEYKKGLKIKTNLVPPSRCIRARSLKRAMSRIWV